MKNVLNYQSSEYDCGPTSLINALRYLFDRKEIQPEILKTIALYTLDTFDTEGEPGKHGTSRMAMRFLANWFNHYGERKNFPIHAAFLEGDQVTMAPDGAVIDALRRGGVAVIHCWLGGDPHYVLLTRILGDEIGLFDPYFIPEKEFLAENQRGQGVRMVDDQPYVMNRAVLLNVLDAQEVRHYSMGAHDSRECMLLFDRRVCESGTDR